MNFDAVTIERMVREVLSEVQRPALVPPSETPRPKTLLTVPTAPVRSVDTPAAVVLRERVITADVLNAQVPPGSKVIIGPKSIVTPSAQDYLRQNRIIVERGETTTTGGNVSGVRWKILMSSVTDQTARAVDVICGQRSQLNREISGSAVEAATSAISAITRAEVAGVMVLTGHPQVVACRANRNAAIRAAVVTDLAGWHQTQTQLKPNVVCISPRERGFMELQNLINKVLSAPAPEVPEGWNA